VADDWYSDWYKWHERYDDPESGLPRRLEMVRDRVRAALDVPRPARSARSASAPARASTSSAPLPVTRAAVT
jgi:hypothetical protein